jgi:hypothetical protein
MTAEQALQDALHIGMTDVMIIGYDTDGDLVIRSSRLTCAEAAFLSLKALRWSESGGAI